MASHLEKFFAIISITLLLTSCYHMRMEPDPIAPRSVESAMPLKDTVLRVRTALENYLGIKIVAENRAASAVSLETHLYEFANETGFGQPPGGRQNLSRFRLEISRNDTGASILIIPFNYQIHTSYAYNESGEVKYLLKKYPYEDYPGMFELSLMNKELDRLASFISKSVKE